MAVQVYLIGKTCFIMDDFHQFLSARKTHWKESKNTKDPEKIVEIAARICRMSFGEKQITKRNVRYIKTLIQKDQMSVFEHVSWNFVITGVSRAFSHQLVRHRYGVSFSQLSQEYCDHSKTKFVKPALTKISKEAEHIWQKSISESKNAYQHMLKALKLKKEEISLAHKENLNHILRATARSILPNATETIIMMTANARALRNFLKIRGSNKNSSEEMKTVAIKILKLLKKEAPVIFYDFNIMRRGGCQKIVVDD